MNVFYSPGCRRRGCQRYQPAPALPGYLPAKLSEISVGDDPRLNPWQRCIARFNQRSAFLTGYQSSCGFSRYLSATGRQLLYWLCSTRCGHLWSPLRRTLFTHQQGAILGDPFVAEIPRSGHTLQVSAEKTLLQVLLEDGVDIDYACEAGTCRSCIIDIISGDIQHKDHCLTEEERKTLMTPCVSRGKGIIVINSL